MKKKKSKWRLIAECAVCGNEILYKKGLVTRCEFCKSRVVWDGKATQEVRGKWGE